MQDDLKKLLPFRRELASPAVRLICLPYAGGSAVIYRKWDSYLPSDVELCSVELPGRATRQDEARIEDFEGLADRLAQSIEMLTDLPFALFGHSMGALLAFEIAHRLTRGGITPVHLFVSARGGPHTPAPLRGISRGPDTLLIEEMRKLGGTPSEILGDSELMKLLLPGVRADLALLDSYEYQDRHRLRCPITAFGGLGDPTISQASLKAWGECTSEAFDVQIFPGGHFFLNSEFPSLLTTIARSIAP